MAYNYDKDTDYSRLIDEAAAKQEWQNAALYEQQRNAKISGEGLDYEQTNKYAGNLDTRDYGTDLQRMMNAGASASDVQSLLDARTNKANSAVNLNQYAYDDIFSAATDYIKRQGMEELTYANAPEYLSRYQDAIDGMWGSLQGNTYQNFLGTDQYGALEGQYTRLGQRAMQDTLGDVSARTGGLASSYAVTAGQQAYGNQMTALEQAALDMWNTDRANQRGDLQTLMQMEGMDYGKYQDQLSQYNTDRNFGYGVTQDNKAWDYQLSQDERAKQEQYAATLAAHGDYSGYLALGYTEAQAQKMFELWKAQNPQLAASLYGGAVSGYGSYGGGGGNNKTPTSGDGTTASEQTSSDFYNSHGVNRYGDMGLPNADSQYYENRYGKQSEPFTASQYAGFSTEVGMMRGDTGRQQAIKDAYYEGKITEAQANQLLAQFNLL